MKVALILFALCASIASGQGQLPHDTELTTSELQQILGIRAWRGVMPAEFGEQAGVSWEHRAGAEVITSNRLPVRISKDEDREITVVVREVEGKLELQVLNEKFSVKMNDQFSIDPEGLPEHDRKSTTYSTRMEGDQWLLFERTYRLQGEVVAVGRLLVGPSPWDAAVDAEGLRKQLKEDLEAVYAAGILQEPERVDGEVKWDWVIESWAKDDQYGLRLTPEYLKKLEVGEHWVRPGQLTDAVDRLKAKGSETPIPPMLSWYLDLEKKKGLNPAQRWIALRIAVRAHTEAQKKIR